MRLLYLFLSGLLPLAAANVPFRDLFFEPNRGQAPARAQYLARTPGAVMLFDAEGVEVRLNGALARPVRLRLEGVSRDARFELLEGSAETTSYFLGADPSKWVRDVPHHRKLAWRGVYPGVDVLFYGTDARLEYDFVLAPGADSSRLRMNVDGATRVESGADGGIVIHAGSERFEMRAPKVYQGSDSVEARYRLDGATVTFEVGDYDRSRELVVDPVVYTVYGGEKDDSVVAITYKGDIVGVTNSSSFTGSFENRGKDIFIWMMPSSSFRTSQLLIIGGSDDDVPTCAEHLGSYLYIGGWTRSADLVRKDVARGVDGFVLQLLPDTPDNLMLTRISGSGDDRVWAVSGSAFAGETNSPDLVARGTVGGQLNGTTDGFYGLAFAGSAIPETIAYWGGSGDDAIYAMKYTENLWLLGGRTTSVDLTVVNAVQPASGGGADGFFVRIPNIAAAGAPIVTYIGGSGDDEVRGIGVTSNGASYFLAGTTASKDLPVLNAAQPSYGGGETDAFLGRMDATSTALGFLTYIGGSGRDEVTSLTLPGYLEYGISDVLLAGVTTSADLPSRNAIQEGLRGPSDGLVVHYDADGAMLTQTWVGGSGSDRLNTIQVTRDFVVTVGGETESNDLSPEAALQGLRDGFTASFPVTRFGPVDDGTNKGLVWTARGMMNSVGFNISANVPSTAMVTVTSSDPSKVLVSFGAATPGAASVSLPRAAAQNYVYVEGVADSGEATVAVTIEGVGTQRVRVRLGAPRVKFELRTPLRVVLGEVFSVLATACVQTDGDDCFPGVLTAGADPIPVRVTFPDPTLVEGGELSGVLQPGTYWDSFVLPLKPGLLHMSATFGSGVVAGPSTYDVDVWAPPYSLPDFTAAKGLYRSVRFTSAASVRGRSLTVTSSDPARLCLSTNDIGCLPSISVSAQGASFRVKALDDTGTVELRFTSDDLGQGSATVTLVRAEPYLATSDSSPVTLKIGGSATLRVYYRNDNARFEAPYPSAPFRVISSNPDVARVTVQDNWVTVTGVSAGQAELRVQVDGFAESTPFPVAVDASVITISAPASLTVGKDLMTPITLYNPRSVPLRLVSSDPKILALSSSITEAGTAEVKLQASLTPPIYAQALAGSGTVTITVSGEGYPDTTIPVRLAPSGYAWEARSYVGNVQQSSVYLGAQLYALDPDSLIPVVAQTLRPGGKAPFKASSSNPNVATYTSSLKVLGVGSTVLSIVQPEGFTTPSLRNDVPVRISTTAVPIWLVPFVGKDLQVEANWSTPSPRKVTLRSEDPAKLLLSLDCSSPGVAQVEPSTRVCLQGLAADGVAMVRATAPEMDDTVFPVALMPSAVKFGWPGPVEYKTLQSDPTVPVTLAMLTPSAVREAQQLRPGAEPLTVGVTSSNPSIVGIAKPSVVFMPGGATGATVKLLLSDPGSAVLHLSPPPAFHTTSNLEDLPVNVSRPSFSVSEVSAMRGLMTPVRLKLPDYPSLDLPATMLFTVTPADPERLLAAASIQDAPSQRTTVMYQSWAREGTVFLEGLVNGATTMTLSASGLEPTPVKVTVQDPQLKIEAWGNTDARSTFSLQVSTGGSMVPAGSSLTIRLRSSDPSVVSVEDSVTIPAGESSATVSAKSLAAGEATITMEPPPGFALAPGAGSARVTVKLPALPFSIYPTLALGNNLQVRETLYQSSVESLPLTVSSSDPSKVVLSLDGTQTGSGSVTVAVPRSQQTSPAVYIQGLASSGTATLTWSAPGYAPRTEQVTLYPSGFAFDRNGFTVSNGGSLNLRVEPVVIGVSYGTGEFIRGGLGPLTVNVTSSATAVATLTPATLTFTGGDEGKSVTFTAVSPGNVMLTVSQPAGFTAPPGALAGAVVQ